MALTLQIVGYKKTGKTTTVTDFLQVAQQLGLKTAVLKHDTHQADLDAQETDTARFKTAGAPEIILQSPDEVFVRKRQPKSQQSAESLIAQYVSPDIELILIEGFKQADFPKVGLLQPDATPADLRLTHVQTYASLWPTRKQAVADFTTSSNRQAWFRGWLSKF